MYYDPYMYDDYWYTDDFENRQLGPQVEFFPPMEETPFQQQQFGRPPFGRPPFGPRPPFFPPIQPIPPFQDGSQGIRRCLNRNTRIWLNNGRNFWFFLTDVNPQSISGFRWTQRGWVRDFINRRSIRHFECQ